MGDRTAHPPVILLGADTPIGLTVIRDLGEHGVPVHAIARSRKGIGLYIPDGPPAVIRARLTTMR